MAARFYPIAVMLLFTLLAACMKSHPDTRVCDLSTGHTTTTQNATVIYKITSVGSVYVNNITYEDGKSAVTIEQPGLPFTVTVPATAGSTIGMQVNGISMEGELAIEQLTIIHNDTLRVREVCAD